MRDGDIVHWEYIHPPRTSPYWTKTQTAIRLSGHLYDTFWMHHRSSRLAGGGFGPKPDQLGRLDPRGICTKKIANLDELEEIHPCEAPLYRSEDIVDLRHSNNSEAPVYRRIGTSRNEEVVRDLIARKKRDAIADIEAAGRRLQRLQHAERRLDAGQIDRILEGDV